jgi:hypothetical protein
LPGLAGFDVDGHDTLVGDEALDGLGVCGRGQARIRGCCAYAGLTPFTRWPVPHQHPGRGGSALRT